MHMVVQPPLHFRKNISNCIVRLDSCRCLYRMDPVLTCCYASHEGIHRHAIPIQGGLLLADPSKKPALRPQYSYPTDQAQPFISKHLFETDNRTPTKDQSQEMNPIQVSIPFQMG